MEWQNEKKVTFSVTLRYFYVIGNENGIGFNMMILAYDPFPFSINSFLYLD